MHTLIAEQSVTDPAGRDWTVGIRWLPRPPKWVGWGPGRGRERESHDNSWLDLVDIPVPDEFPVLIVIVGIIVALVLAWFVVLPIAIFALDLLFLILIAVLSVAARVFFRRPWIVEATTEHEKRHWAVVGFGASRKRAYGIVQSLQRGEDITESA